jgi:hypothetical protein
VTLRFFFTASIDRRGSANTRHSFLPFCWVVHNRLAGWRSTTRRDETREREGENGSWMKFRESTDGSSSRQLSVIRRKSIIQAELSLSLSSGLAGDGHREKLGDSSISLSLSPNPQCHSIGSDPARCQHYQKAKSIYMRLACGMRQSVDVVRIHQQCPA